MNRILHFHAPEKHVEVSTGGRGIPRCEYHQVTLNLGNHRKASIIVSTLLNVGSLRLSTYQLISVEQAETEFPAVED